MKLFVRYGTCLAYDPSAAAKAGLKRWEFKAPQL